MAKKPEVAREGSQHVGDYGSSVCDGRGVAPTGALLDRHVLRCKTGSTVPATEDGRVVLVEQFRFAREVTLSPRGDRARRGPVRGGDAEAVETGYRLSSVTWRS